MLRRRPHAMAARRSNSPAPDTGGEWDRGQGGWMLDDLCLTIDLTKMALHLIDEDRGEDCFAVRCTGRVRQHARLIGRFQGEKEEQGLFTGLVGRREQDFAEEAAIQDADEFFRQTRGPLDSRRDERCHRALDAR